MYIEGLNDHIIFNNIQSYNNSYGIAFNDSSAKSYITINNSQLYNNSSHGLLVYRTSNMVINNSHVYNNS
ncbi:hypothetical protein KKG31_00970 [Patescibacteria group bacterium]|nr:hypothetical protein [Patescibacteria group bacterium]MBU1757752.1 hypothetical protein [Patescibacteria group bacterium]